MRYFSRLKKILGEKVKGGSFENVVRSRLTYLTKSKSSFKMNLGIYSQTHLGVAE